MKYAIGAVAVLAAPCLCGIVLAHGAIAVAKREPAARPSVAAGLSLTPQRVEKIARVGATGAVTVANGTGRPIRVTVRVRPWRQARGGVVTPDLRRTLRRQLAVSPSAFRLAAGVRRTVSIRLKRHPSGGSLFGGIDVVGVPVGAKPLNGIVPRYPAGVRPVQRRWQTEKPLERNGWACNECGYRGPAAAAIGG